MSAGRPICSSDPGAGRRRRIGGVLAVACALLGAPALATDVPAAGGVTEICPTPAQRDAAALEQARGCAIGLERDLGPDAPALRPVFSRLGDWFAGDPATASGAMFFRNRALRLATAIDGPVSRGAADASLALARASILSGRCTAQDPKVLPLIRSAAAGYASLPADDPARRAGLLAAARAHADLLDFAAAADLLTVLGPAAPAEWELLGNWRRLEGDLRAAADAWRQGWDRAPGDSRVRQRLQAHLLRAYFELGDRAGAREIHPSE